MREIRKSGSEGGAGQTNVPFLPLSAIARQRATTPGKIILLSMILPKRVERRETSVEGVKPRPGAHSDAAAGSATRRFLTKHSKFSVKS